MHQDASRLRDKLRLGWVVCVIYEEALPVLGSWAVQYLWVNLLVETLIKMNWGQRQKISIIFGNHSRTCSRTPTVRRVLLSPISTQIPFYQSHAFFFF